MDDSCLENVSVFCILLFKAKGLGKLLLENVVPSVNVILYCLIGCCSDSLLSK